MSKYDDETLLTVAIALVVVVVIWLLGAWALQWAWNAFMPLVWKAAPHLRYWQAVALGLLIGTVKGIFSASATAKGDK